MEEVATKRNQYTLISINQTTSIKHESINTIIVKKYVLYIEVLPVNDELHSKAKKVP